MFIKLEPQPTSTIYPKLNYVVYKNLEEDNIDCFTYASVIFKFEDMNGEAIASTIQSSIADDLLFERFDNFSVKISKISRLAEIINYDLDTVIRIYLKTYKFRDVISRNSKCRELGIYENTQNFDFTKFAKLLSCILNSDKQFSVIEELNTKDKIKFFTTTLHDYIINRNYYTHGNLLIGIPDYNPILSVVKNGSDHYIMLSETIINDSLKAFKFLERNIKNINKVCSGLYTGNSDENGLRIYLGAV